MPVMSTTSLLKTPLDYVAEGYWQDFLAKSAIAGGIAYEAELYSCQLDESLASLQRVDTLLTQIRRDMIKAGMWHEATLLTDEPYRNFMVFLAFYAGRVLAKQWQDTPRWLGQFELHQRYPALPLIADDFYQHIAVLYNIQGRVVTPVFFALQPIGLRLFGHIDRQFEAVGGGQVASGLYQAVSMRLPDGNTDYVTANQAAPMPTPNANSNLSSNTSLEASLPVMLNKIIADDVPYEITPKTAVKVNNTTTASTVSNPVSDTLKPIVSHSDNDMTALINNHTPLDAKTETRLSSPSKDTQAKVILSPTPDIFTQLLIELDEIEVVQTAGNHEYQQAREILDQFEQHIAKQHKPRAQVVFSETHQAHKQQALRLMMDAADLGNTAAMLHLGMYEILSEVFLNDNSLDAAQDAANNQAATSSDVGVEWIKQAANKKDSRAQRLLSKMYYQGIGLPQDIDNGKYWLEQAAENGHLEAASVAAQWQQAQVLVMTQRQEQDSIKRYQLLIGVVVIVALLLIIFI